MTRAEFCAFARAHDNFVILTHRRPDGDTIGSAGALCLGLRQLGKTAFVLTDEQFTPRFDPFLDGLGCGAPPAGPAPTLPGLEPRGTIPAERETPWGQLRGIGVHLALLSRSRRMQLAAIVAALSQAARARQTRPSESTARDSA